MTALDHPCSKCGARPGARCTSPRGRTLTTPHPSRGTTTAAPTAHRPGAWPAGTQPPAPDQPPDGPRTPHATCDCRRCLTYHQH